MTKQEFWNIIASNIENCDYCPVRIHGDNKKYKCNGDCVEAIKRLYSQLRDSEGDKTNEVSL